MTLERIAQSISIIAKTMSRDHDMSDSQAIMLISDVLREDAMLRDYIINRAINRMNENKETVKRISEIYSLREKR